MTYNLSGIGDNTTGVLSLAQHVNTHLMGGSLGIQWLIIIFVVSVMGFLVSSRQAARSVVAASFITMISSFLLRLVSLIPDLAVFISIVLFAGSAVLALKDS